MYKVLSKYLLFLLLLCLLELSKDKWEEAISNNLWTNFLRLRSLQRKCEFLNLHQ